MLSVLLPPRGTSQAFPLAGDTQGQMDGLGWTVSGTGHGAGVALVAPGGSWPGRGLLGCRAAGSGGWRRVGGTGMERGFAGSCSPRMRDQNPAGSPTALPPPRQHRKGHRGAQDGGKAGGSPHPAPHRPRYLCHASMACARRAGTGTRCSSTSGRGVPMGQGYPLV